MQQARAKLLQENEEDKRLKDHRRREKQKRKAEQDKELAALDTTASTTKPTHDGAGRRIRINDIQTNTNSNTTGTTGTTGKYKYKKRREHALRNGKAL